MMADNSHPAEDNAQALMAHFASLGRSVAATGHSWRVKPARLAGLTHIARRSRLYHINSAREGRLGRACVARFAGLTAHAHAGFAPCVLHTIMRRRGNTHARVGETVQSYDTDYGLDHLFCDSNQQVSFRSRQVAEYVMDLCARYTLPHQTPFVALELFELVCKMTILGEKGLSFGHTGEGGQLHVAADTATLDGAGKANKMLDEMLDPLLVAAVAVMIASKQLSQMVSTSTPWPAHAAAYRSRPA